MIVKMLIFIFLVINSFLLFGQISYIIEGTEVNNKETGSWDGVNIQRSVPTTFAYLNNNITSVNAEGYLLQAGDEGISKNNNNLQGEIISGNMLIWDGTDATSISHGIFTGYNINAIIKYNYLNKVPLGINRKSNGMTDNSGGIFYNIINKTQTSGITIKGMNGVNIYNNTFYSDQIYYIEPDVGTYRGLIDIYSNTGVSPNAPSRGTKIKNNIFYTVHQIPNIYIYGAECIPNFESDYNIFYCESGEPLFNYLGKLKTFSEWQTLGYDKHSIVVNPDFIDKIDFIPGKRLNYGTNLGSAWQTGLSTTAKWIVGTSPKTTNQNGTWQVGARIYPEILLSEINITTENGLNTITTDKGTLQLNAVLLPNDALNTTISWSVQNVTGKSTISSTGLLTAEKNGTVIATATANDGSGVVGELQITISSQIIPVESITIIDNIKNDTIIGIGTKLNLKTSVSPQEATNPNIDWVVENITGKASIDKNGVLITISPGLIKVIAKTMDESNVHSFKEYKIVIPVVFLQHIITPNYKIYPNPTKGLIKISVAQMPADGVIVEIWNYKGQALLKKRIFENLSEWPLDQYASSIYFVTIIDNKKVFTQKIVNSLMSK